MQLGSDEMGDRHRGHHCAPASRGIGAESGVKQRINEPLT